jgi:hypothetical protein
VSSFSSPVFSEWAKMPIRADPSGRETGSHFP